MAQIQIDPLVVAEAVFLALRADEERGGRSTSEFHRERDALYARAPAEQRETLFAAHDGEWFRRLGLIEPVSRALASVPLIARTVDFLIVRRAVRSKDEGSELYRGERQRLVLALLPLRFADPPKLFEIALRELLYCDDMLDPQFGYAPEIPVGETQEPARAELARDRFRVLWETRISGKLARNGIDPVRPKFPPARFARAFAGAAPNDEWTALYRDVFDGRVSTAGMLWSCAQDPMSGHQSAGHTTGAREG